MGRISLYNLQTLSVGSIERNWALLHDWFSRILLILQIYSLQPASLSCHSTSILLLTVAKTKYWKWNKSEPLGLSTDTVLYLCTMRWSWKEIGTQTCRFSFLSIFRTNYGDWVPVANRDWYQCFGAIRHRFPSRIHMNSSLLCFPCNSLLSMVCPARSSYVVFSLSLASPLSSAVSCLLIHLWIVLSNILHQHTPGILPRFSAISRSFIILIAMYIPCFVSWIDFLLSFK